MTLATRWVLHPEELSRIDYRPLLRKLAEDVANDARRIAPVDTGRLRSSIGVGDIDNDGATVTATAPYAGYVELGTRRMAAQPYLKPALYRFRG